MTALSMSCPAGCGRPQEREPYFCGPCWWQVPQRLRSRMLRTWKVWVFDVNNRVKYRAYRAAADAALASVP